MKNVTKDETRTGNPQWFHRPTGIDIYYTKGNGPNSKKALLYVHHKDLKAYDLTNRESDKQTNKHNVYLKQVTMETYCETFEGLMNQIETLHRLNISPVDIITKIYETEKGTKETEIEVENLKSMFKEVTEEYNAQMEKLEGIKQKLNLICKEMEML